MLPIARGTANIYTWRGAYFVLGAIMMNGIALSGIFASYEDKQILNTEEDTTNKNRTGICRPLRNKYFMMFTFITTLFFFAESIFHVIFVSSHVQRDLLSSER